MKRRSINMLTLSILTISLLFTGCNKTEAPKSSETEKSAVSETVAQFSEETISIKGSKYDIPGILAKPTTIQGDKSPVILMLHGTASQKNEAGDLYKMLAAKLAENGYASLRIDFAGTGDSSVDYKEYTLTSATNDSNSAIEYLQSLEDLDSDRIGIIGFSQGGLIAQLVAANNPAIKSMVTWSSTAGDGVENYDFAFGPYYETAKKDGFAVVEFPWRDSLNFSLQWFEEIKANSQKALDDMKNYKGNLLTIVGGNDETVDPSLSMKIINSAGSDNASYYLIKGADHIYNCFSEDRSDVKDLLETTQQWFSNNL